MGRKRGKRARRNKKNKGENQCALQQPMLEQQPVYVEQLIFPDDEYESFQELLPKIKDQLINGDINTFIATVSNFHFYALSCIFTPHCDSMQWGLLHQEYMPVFEKVEQAIAQTKQANEKNYRLLHYLHAIGLVLQYYYFYKKDVPGDVQNKCVRTIINILNDVCHEEFDVATTVSFYALMMPLLLKARRITEDFIVCEGRPTCEIVVVGELLNDEMQSRLNLALGKVIFNALFKNYFVFKKLVYGTINRSKFVNVKDLFPAMIGIIITYLRMRLIIIKDINHGNNKEEHQIAFDFINVLVKKIFTEYWEMRKAQPTGGPLYTYFWPLIQISVGIGRFASFLIKENELHFSMRYIELYKQICRFSENEFSINQVCLIRRNIKLLYNVESMLKSLDDTIEGHNQECAKQTGERFAMASDDESVKVGLNNKKVRKIKKAGHFGVSRTRDNRQQQVAINTKNKLLNNNNQKKVYSDFEDDREYDSEDESKEPEHQILSIQETVNHFSPYMRELDKLHNSFNEYIESMEKLKENPEQYTLKQEIDGYCLLDRIEAFIFLEEIGLCQIGDQVEILTVFEDLEKNYEAYERIRNEDPGERVGGDRLRRARRIFEIQRAVFMVGNAFLKDDEFTGVLTRDYIMATCLGFVDKLIAIDMHLSDEQFPQGGDIKLRDKGVIELFKILKKYLVSLANASCLTEMAREVKSLRRKLRKLRGRNKKNDQAHDDIALFTEATIAQTASGVASFDEQDLSICRQFYTLSSQIFSIDKMLTNTTDNVDAFNLDVSEALMQSAGSTSSSMPVQSNPIESSFPSISQAPNMGGPIVSQLITPMYHQFQGHTADDDLSHLYFELQLNKTPIRSLIDWVAMLTRALNSEDDRLVKSLPDIIKRAHFDIQQKCEMSPDMLRYLGPALNHLGDNAQKGTLNAQNAQEILISLKTSLMDKEKGSSQAAYSLRQ